MMYSIDKWVDNNDFKKLTKKLYKKYTASANPKYSLLL